MTRPGMNVNAIADARSHAGSSAASGRICVVHIGDAPALIDVLRAERYDVVPVGIGRASIADVATADPDVVVVALDTDEFDVVRLCAGLRRSLDCRIVVVVAPAHMIDEETVIEMLDAGVDDFVSAATGSPVLLARLRAAMRARPMRPRAPQEIVLGDVLIDLDAHAVLVCGAVVSCPPRQFDMLVALGSNAGTMILRDTLIADVWGVPPASVDPRRVRIAISLLRGILGSGPRRPVIESVSRIGYRLVVPGLSPEG